VGVRGLASALPRLGVAIVREVVRAEIVVLRLPGMIGFLAAYACRILGRRYAVEVVGDPVAVLASGSLGRTGRLLAPFAGWQMRRVVSGASAALYVTQSTLQRRYPTARRVPVTGVSTVRIDETAFVDKGRRWRPGPPRIVTVGSQEVRYKGHDVLLHAIQRLHSAGAPVTAVIVGDGRLHGDLVDLAVNLGIRECVTFTGAIHDRAELMAQLDQATLFVLPSRTEGLPRALIEAMARALPAVASDVGGISELLEAEFLVPVEDPAALADRISALGSDPARWEAQSKRNLEVSRAYHAAALDARFDHWLSGIPVARHRGQP
jgi:glycosyltransferase involved in cell wall biosynthesis